MKNDVNEIFKIIINVHNAREFHDALHEHFYSDVRYDIRS